MPKISEEFSGSFLSTSDVSPEGSIYTIASCDYEKVGKDDEKLVLRFEDCDLGLPLNKTNATMLASMYGDDTDEWIAHTVNVYRSKTDFNGRRVACIRVGDPDASDSDSDSGSGSGSTNGKKGKVKKGEQSKDIPF